MMGMSRDFCGYWGVELVLCWLNGVCFVVFFVVNVEEGVEFLIVEGDECNEVIYEVCEEVIGVLDLCMESYFGYGFW